MAGRSLCLRGRSRSWHELCSHGLAGYWRAGADRGREFHRTAVPAR